MISRTTKLLLISILITYSFTQDAPAEKPADSDFENCKEDFKPSADGGKLGCKTCNPTFFPAVQNTGKTPELALCAKCKDNCDKCKPDTADPKLPGDCETCSEGFAKDPADAKACKACEDTNCALCADDIKKCTQCKAKFALKDDKCVACPTGCDECSDEKTCTKCTAGPTYLSSGTCKSCKANCASCTNETDCQACQAGTFLKGNECVQSCGAAQVGIAGKCAKCSDNCVRCTKANTCAQCIEGYFANQQTLQCQNCPAGCGVCANDGSCESCTTGSLQSDGSCGEDPWYKKWWAWLLIGLGVLALLGGIASLLAGSKTPARQYGSYQQYDNSYVANQSYAPRASMQMSQAGRMSQNSQVLLGPQQGY